MPESAEVPACPVHRTAPYLSRTARKGDKMNFGSRRMIPGAMETVVVCLLGVPLASGQVGQDPRAQMAEAVFKNVQMLKGIAVDEFMDTTGMLSAARRSNCIDWHLV